MKMQLSNLTLQPKELKPSEIEILPPDYILAESLSKKESLGELSGPGMMKEHQPSRLKKLLKIYRENS